MREAGGQFAKPGIFMYRYTRADFDRVLEFVRGLYEPRTAEGLRDHLLPAMRALVPSAFAAEASYEVGAPQQGQTQRSDPPELRSAEADAALARHMPTSPIVVHFERTRCEEFTRWSDVQPLSQFLRTALYNEVYRPLGIKDGCSLFLRSGPNHLEFAGVGLHKQYADAHRDVLASVSPHVLQAFRLAHTTSALIEMAAMKSGPNCADRGFMAIDLNGTITMETAAATRALEKFFPKRTEHGLPEQLARWISQSEQAMRKATDVPDTRRPFVIARNGERLTVNLLSKPEQSFLILEEHRLAIDPASLSSLPLTRRESEVLAYVAVGKTNPEVGIILGISPRTVSKHVEHILQRLGVETRTAAAASALEAANL
jgi:DNA-binding CsgD family transcriptional regulator